MSIRVSIQCYLAADDCYELIIKDDSVKQRSSENGLTLARIALPADKWAEVIKELQELGVSST